MTEKLTEKLVDIINKNTKYQISHPIPIAFCGLIDAWDVLVDECLIYAGNNIFSLYKKARPHLENFYEKTKPYALELWKQAKEAHKKDFYGGMMDGLLYLHDITSSITHDLLGRPSIDFEKSRVNIKDEKDYWHECPRSLKRRAVSLASTVLTSLFYLSFVEYGPESPSSLVAALPLLTNACMFSIRYTS